MDTKLNLLILLIILINPVSSKFICGEVSSSDQLSPAWFEVTAFLQKDKSINSTCQISPSNNKYCCEILEDEQKYQWKPGDIFEISITDKPSGYFAPPQKITLTNQGYDIIENLTLEKAIKITSPNSTLIISQEKSPIQTEISKYCTNTSISQNQITFGENKIKISTICNGEQFNQENTFYQLEKISFQKIFPEKIKEKEIASIKITGTLSEEVENIKLKEYIPSSWKISKISNNGTIEFSTPQYNVITWQVSGKNFDFDYKAKAPEIESLTNHYTFKTTIDDYDLGERTIQVYKILPFPSNPKPSQQNYEYTPKKLSKVSKELPLISQNQEIIAALYSTKIIEQAGFELINFSYKGKIPREYIYLNSYEIQRTLNSTESQKIIIEYLTNKTFLEENDYKKIFFFKKQDNKFIKIKTQEIPLGGGEIKYRFESSQIPIEIFILAEKNSLTIIDKMLNFLDKLKFWNY